jgi:hypothetical protein
MIARQNSFFTSRAMLGVFRINVEASQEFINLLRHSSG